MVESVNLQRDLCPHWRFYSEWIVGKELAVWMPGAKWNATAKNRLSYARRNGYYDYHANWQSWNHHREDIFKINSSATVRQHNPMNPAYFDYPEEKHVVNTCKFHRYDLILVRNENTVLSYAITHTVGELMNISTIIGHYDYLKEGIMLPLMAMIQSVAVQNGVKYVTYGEWWSGHNDNGKNGLQYWKHSVGFKSMHLNEIT